MYKADVAKLLATHGLFGLIGERSEDLFPAMWQVFGGQGGPGDGVGGGKVSIEGRRRVRLCISLSRKGKDKSRDNANANGNKKSAVPGARCIGLEARALTR